MQNIIQIYVNYTLKKYSILSRKTLSFQFFQLANVLFVVVKQERFNKKSQQIIFQLYRIWNFFLFLSLILSVLINLFNFEIVSIKIPILAQVSFMMDQKVSNWKDSLGLIKKNLSLTHTIFIIDGFHSTMKKGFDDKDLLFYKIPWYYPLRYRVIFLVRRIEPLAGKGLSFNWINKFDHLVGQFVLGTQLNHVKFKRWCSDFKG